MANLHWWSDGFGRRPGCIPPEYRRDASELRSCTRDRNRATGPRTVACTPLDPDSHWRERAASGVPNTVWNIPAAVWWPFGVIAFNYSA